MALGQPYLCFSKMKEEEEEEGEEGGGRRKEGTELGREEMARRNSRQPVPKADHEPGVLETLHL